MPPTTFTARMRSKNSSYQSCSVTGLMSGTMAFVFSHPLISTPWPWKIPIISGRKSPATSSSTSRVSMALHTPGRCTLALRQMVKAFEKSASLSTKMWHTPL